MFKYVLIGAIFGLCTVGTAHAGCQVIILPDGNTVFLCCSGHVCTYH